MLLLQSVVEYGCRSLQIFGDSMTIINWEKGIQRCHILILLPILEEVQHILQHFDYVSITHVYTERNHLEDTISKEGVKL